MTVPEIVAQPVEAIQRLYQQAGCPRTDGDWGAASHFEAATAALRPGELPCLNIQSAEKIPHHSLVSFFGMVQDTLNPEYYVGAFRRPNGQMMVTKYSDPDMREVDDAEGNEPPVVWERRPMVLTPVPGLSNWASTFISGRPDVDAIGAAHSGSESAIDQAEGGAVEPPLAQLQAQAQTVRSQRPKRERSSDADLTLPDASTDAERGSPAPTVGAPGAGPLSEPSPGQLEEESSMQDTDLTVDQGIPGSGTTGDAATGVDYTDEDAARPRTRRREDSGRGAQAPAGDGDRTAEGGVAGDGAAGGGAAGAAADSGGSAAGGAAASALAAPGDRPVGEVSGSCIAYLYDNSISPLLHEVVHVIGVVSHVPHFALLGYDNPDEGLDQELAALELGNAAAAGGGRGAPALTSACPHDCEHGRNQARQEEGSVEASVDAGGPAASAAAGAERLADAAIRASHPLTSQVMRVHAILVRRSPPLVPPPPPAITTAAAAAAPTGTVAPAAPSTDNAMEPAAPPSPATTAAAATTTATNAEDLTRSLTPVGVGVGAVAPLRERALALLRLALGGDALAAEYVLLQLLSRVGRVSRGDAAALGQMALNLCMCPPGGPTAAADVSSSCCTHSAPALLSDRLGRGPGSLAAGLQAAISCLLPLSVALPVSLEALNGAPWAPTRDPVRERTQPSPLQLAPGTVVVLDETVMAAGRFSDQGFKSFQALDALVRRQELVYDFETSQHPIPVDLPLIVLTEGRSLLREGVPIRLPLNATQPLPTVEAILSAAADTPTAPADEQEPAAADTPSSGSSNPQPRSAPEVTDLVAVRAYLAAARLQEGYDLAEGMATTLEQYFVDARRAGGAGPGAERALTGAGGQGAAASGGGMTPGEFHMKLTLARLLVQSYGEKRLTRQRWQQLLQLEHLREARLRVGA